MKLSVLVAIVLCAIPLRGEAGCRLALAMGLDVSGSVDDSEYALQMSGLAEALGDEDVAAAIFAMPDAPVAIAIYEWSSSRYQRIVRDWIVLNSRAELDAVTDGLLTWRRETAPEATGLGASMQFGKVLLDGAPQCWVQTLDLSGDGKNNDWPDPVRVRATGTTAGIRINGLVIAPDPAEGSARMPLDAAELSAYFTARVIQGPNAFVEVALGFDDYADAMKRKLLRELNTRPVGQLDTDTEFATLNGNGDDQ